MRSKLTLHFLFLLFPFSLMAQPQLELQFFASGFDEPVDIAHAGDDRLFVVEKDGRIRILRPDGSIDPIPYLDISGPVGSGGFEEGLLGLVFHPDYAGNGYFYVNYTSTDGDTRIARFERDPADPNRALPGSQKILLTVSQPFNNHNAGDLAFGPDGYLYIPLGDGGSGGDPGNRSQDPLTLLGKMLRIDVDGGDPYAIPPDNPFADDDFTLDEIWALGLRNPWRISFDRETGDLWIADVGQSEYEEVNFQEAGSEGGQNYGWRCYEGSEPYNLSGCGSIGNYTFPVAEYPHVGSFCGGSITGGFVYRGAADPFLQGLYIYADYCQNVFYTLGPDGMGGWEQNEALTFSGFEAVTFGEDVDGELYVARLGEGEIYRVRSEQCAGLLLDLNISPACPDTTGSIDIVVSGGAPPYDFDLPGDPAALPPGDYELTATDANGCQVKESFTIAQLSPPEPEFVIENDSVSVNDIYSSYQWYYNDVLIPGATGPAVAYAGPGTYTVEVVEPSSGCTLIAMFIADPVSTQDLEWARSFRLSPNPASDWAEVRFSAPDARRYTLGLQDASGKLLREWPAGWAGEGPLRLELGGLPAGLYFLQLRGPQGVAVRKLVKK